MTRKPRISKEFEYAEWYYTCACSACLTTVQLGCSDFKYTEKGSKISFRYRCPICGRPVIVDTDYLPKPIQERSKIIEDARKLALLKAQEPKDCGLTEAQQRNLEYTRGWHREKRKKNMEAKRAAAEAKPLEVINGEAG